METLTKYTYTKTITCTQMHHPNNEIITIPLHYHHHQQQKIDRNGISVLFWSHFSRSWPCDSGKSCYISISHCGRCWCCTSIAADHRFRMLFNITHWINCNIVSTKQAYLIRIRRRDENWQVGHIFREVFFLLSTSYH